MEQIIDAYSAGLFATLAYANLSSAMALNGQDREDQLKRGILDPDNNGKQFNDKFLTESQAKEFTDHYELFDYKEYSATGFAATVFREKNTNRFIIAFRGMEPKLSADIYSGIAVALGATELAPQAWSLSLYREHLRTIGVLNSGNTLDIAGLSLGGYLAQVMALAEGPERFGHIWTFNAPGVGGGLGREYLEKLGLASANYNAPNVTHYRSDGWSLVEGLGTYLGQEVTTIFTEHGSSHTTSYIVTSLAVMRVFERLSPNLSIAQMNQLLESANKDDVGTEKHLLDVLAEIVLPTAKPSADSRDAILASVDKLLDALPASNNGYGLQVLATQNAASIVGKATKVDAEGQAYRYALYALNPFALTGANYSRFASALELYDSHTGNGALSKSWLQDRAAMLSFTLAYNRRDLAYDQPYPTGRGGANTAASHQQFVDATQNVFIDTSGVNASDDNYDRRFYFGSTGDDTYSGGIQSDRLYGMAGADTLNGDAGNDWLEGGAGNDQLRGGVGNDVINGDADNDAAFGEDGNDSLYGGTGSDSRETRGQV